VRTNIQNSSSIESGLRAAARGGSIEAGLALVMTEVNFDPSRKSC
jgi:hypothetical protein